ncbi:protein-methionine-sulfoxide reductase catalytic subunit MsrP [Sulfurirhabdus autotrophica]|uniref:Protein-methionine-sulfoxide reductase catalytic subunit MsrP n=1 Tax=Sulfurirhabdus autotrophica TaxID=1706046 RepID=A0A4R3Y4S4_9PROT|nr:protein-methionine-sulfoxide reductase catalytic subunit MsrP [Sulfurirhabdus autotrophica]TCV86411.1 sulfoxide reductase catalytic subunit YedY [Sulfurirhabdus autotrophica]
MLIKQPSDIKPSEITDKRIYQSRRDFMGAATKSIAAVAAGIALPGLLSHSQEVEAATAAKLSGLQKSSFSVTDPLTPYKDVTSYNNFYEFDTDKSSPAQMAGTLNTRPWTVAVEGEVKRPKVYDIEDLLKLVPLEERIYRLRCVEGWSMVIPWVGFSLSELIKQVEPTGNAKFVEFTTLHDPKQFPGQRSGVLDWPYVEGLRIDEAMNPLTLMAVGLYGEVLPNQNGAPVRLVVPWKYGFKSAKSIVKIRFVSKPTNSSWMKANPREYGFFANVNPNVDHPRWSQAKERRIGEFFKRETLMYNGYGDQVARMYAGLDLKKYF